MSVYKLNYVACYAYKGKQYEGTWELEFCHDFEDVVAARAWIDLQVEEHIISSPAIRSTSTGRDAQTVVHVFNNFDHYYKYILCNAYAAEIFTAGTDVDVTDPTPLWDLVVYRTRVPDFDPELEQTYADTPEEAARITLRRLGINWSVYSTAKVDWASLR